MGIRSAYLAIAAAVTIAATAATGADVDDHALRFVSDQRHEVEVGLISAPGDQYTVEAWIRLSTGIPTEREGGEIVGQHADDTDAKGTLDIQKRHLRFLINTSESRHHELLSDREVPLGVWTHMAGVYDGAHMKLYINGQQVGERAVTGPITGFNKRRSTRIGGYAGTHIGHFWFAGDIDEARIWALARTQEQLLADMFHPISPQTGLIGYWRFDEGSGPTAADLSGNDYHGQLTNYRGSGQPVWVPGVFSQIDTLERRRAALAGQPLPTIFLDLDMEADDQGVSTLHSVEPGGVYWLQLHVKDAPEIDGWSATLQYDPEKLRFIEDSYQPSDFIPGLSGRIDVRDEGLVVVGGTVSDADGRNAGNGFLGTIAFEVLGEFAGQTEIVVTELTLERIDGSALQEQTLSSAWLVSWVTAVLEASRGGTPAMPSLSQNYPNPFNSSTTIRFSLPKQERVALAIYNLAGQQVVTLAHGQRETGTHTLRWDGRNDDGGELASGIYLYRLQVDEQAETRKLLLLR